MRRAILNASVVAIANILMVLAATPAAGETIRIRSGRAAYDTGDPASLMLTGDEFALNSLFLSLATIPCFSGCRAGTSVSLSTLFEPLGEGGAIVGGTSYGRDNLGPGPGDVAFQGRLLFDAATLIPDTDDPFVQLTSRFRLTGHIAAFPNLTATVPLFEVDVTGSGLATVFLDRFGDSGLYYFSSADYTIQDPVPEPTTLLLFGSGVTALVIRRRETRA